MFIALALLAVLVCVGCWIAILINAFEDEVWKGIVCFFFWPYTLYFALVEFDHESKWLIVAGWLGGFILAFVFAFASIGRG
jgi:hypothetical protein